MANHDPADSVVHRQKTPFQRTERAMMASVNDVIEAAAKHAHDEEPDIARRLPLHYFRRAALQLLFLQICGADLETSEGGDPGIARRVLHVGRSIASQWDHRRGSHHEQDNRERQELAKGAERAALKIVLRALVEHAGASDPDLKDRISAAADAYLAELAPQSAPEKQFAERTRDFVSMFAGFPVANE